MTQTLYKLSITSQSYRLFSTARSHRRISYLMIWVTACGIVMVFATLFPCVPVQKAWRPELEGTCIARAPFFLVASSINILNDLALMVRLALLFHSIRSTLLTSGMQSIPIPLFRKLTVPRKQRLLLLSVFTCGLLVTVVSLIRLKPLLESEPFTTADDPGHFEKTVIKGTDIALWSDLEINIAIICGSVPALKAFVSRVILGHEGPESHHQRGTHLTSNSGASAKVADMESVPASPTTPTDGKIERFTEVSLAAEDGEISPVLDTHHLDGSKSWVPKRASVMTIPSEWQEEDMENRRHSRLSS